MKLRSQLQGLKEHLHLTGGKRIEEGQETSPTHPYPEEDVAQTLSEAEQVEATRHELLSRSHDIRLGLDSDPRETIRALSQAAELLLDSDAPPWEVATTLSQTAANLQASPIDSPAKQHLTRLAISALKAHYPETSDDPRGFSDLESEVHIDAIRRTTPEVPFLEALSESWTNHNHPLEQIIDRTGIIVEEANKELKAKAAADAKEKQKLEAARPQTGVFDPFADDEPSSKKDTAA